MTSRTSRPKGVAWLAAALVWAANATAADYGAWNARIADEQLASATGLSIGFNSLDGD